MTTVLEPPLPHPTADEIDERVEDTIRLFTCPGWFELKAIRDAAKALREQIDAFQCGHPDDCDCPLCRDIEDGTDPAEVWDSLTSAAFALHSLRIFTGMDLPFASFERNTSATAAEGTGA